MADIPRLPFWGLALAIHFGRFCCFYSVCFLRVRTSAFASFPRRLIFSFVYFGEAPIIEWRSKVG